MKCAKQIGVDKSKMAQKGGNPGLKKYQFTTDRDEPLTEKFTLRVTQKMLLKLQAVKGNWREFVRDAIAQKLREVKE